MKGHISLLVLVFAIGYVNSTPSMITTNQDGSINCDGLRCPRGNGVRCEVSSQTVNGHGVVDRKCIDASGAVLAQASYNEQSPGLTFARHSSTAVLYNKKN